MGDTNETDCVTMFRLFKYPTGTVKQHLDADASRLGEYGLSEGG